MTTDANRAAALAMLEAIAASDVAAMGALAAPNATWWTLGHGPREKAASFEAMLPGLPATLARVFDGPIQFTIQGVTAEGDRVAIEADSLAKLNAGGTYANRYHWLFIFEGGKIATIREYNDTAYVRDVMG